MIVLITGGSKNGKSKIAERIAVSYDLPRVYIATMEPYGDEARETIARHRKARAGKGFKTVERYTDIGGADIPDGCAALIECIGNLCANEMFSGAGKTGAAGRIAEGVARLSKKAKALVIVTNQVGADGIKYGNETMEYIKIMGEINRRLSDMADCVIEAVYGIPLALKGEMPK